MASSVGDLQQAIRGYVSDGYMVVSQTPDTAQLVRPKRFSFLWALLWFLFCGVGIVVYLVHYAARRDSTVYLQRTPYGITSSGGAGAGSSAPIGLGVVLVVCLILFAVCAGPGLISGFGRPQASVQPIAPTQTASPTAAIAATAAPSPSPTADKAAVCRSYFVKAGPMNFNADTITQDWTTNLPEGATIDTTMNQGPGFGLAGGDVPVKSGVISTRFRLWSGAPPPAGRTYAIWIRYPYTHTDSAGDAIFLSNCGGEKAPNLEGNPQAIQFQGSGGRQIMVISTVAH